MVSSPVSSRSRRVAGTVVTAAAAFALVFLFQIVLAQIVLAQRPNRPAPDKGPRAMGLLEFGPGGKAHLIPITIMIDGKFYDASAYKASPVPMAVDPGTVYEAVRTGVSEGLFTISSALQSGTAWLGAGTWLSAEEVKARAAKKKARDAAKPAKKAYDEDQGGPPVLRHAASDQGADKAGGDKSNSAPASPSAAPASASANTPPPSPASSATAAPAPARQLSSSSNDDDPNRPELRRGGSPAKIVKTVVASAPVAKASQIAAIGTSPEPQVVAAISDAGGPEPRSFAFDMKPEEESKFRTKMLAEAALEINARAKPDTGTGARPPARKGKPAKSADPSFEDVHLRVFDLSASNEPILILTAKAHITGPPSPTTYFVTLIDREDIYGDLHKALANVTDNQHLDILPRLDLIDAVDVDGDGRAELLFHQVYDRGAAYVVYRVIGNQLWPLYQGATG